MTATELGRLLALRAEETARLLLPFGKRHGKEWMAGSTAGESGSSLKVVLEGPKAGMWVDFGGGEADKGDFIGLWQKTRGVDLATACRQAEEFLGLQSEHRHLAPRLPTREVSEQWADLQKKLRKGAPEELDALAQLRGLPSVAGLELASAANQLFFADIRDDGFDCPCWILTDDTRLNAQARKMDGSMWTGVGAKDIKCKTITGCMASWPVGLHGINGKDIALVEGSPDHLAAWHYIWASKLHDRIAPVSMFGASMNLPEEAVPLFRGKTVHAFPHNDEAGRKAMAKWEAQAGVSFHKFDLSAHQKKDLNELVAATTEVPPDIFSPADEFESQRITLASSPTEPTTRLFLAGKPVATPGNLVTLISKAKTGKTATIGGVVAAIVAAHYDRHDLDTFGFTAPHTNEAVILIDTEQSPFDAFTCHKRAMARANQESDPEWFLHYALVGHSHAKLRHALTKILARAKATHGGVFTVILDGVADFVPSVNDEIGCNEFISWLRLQAVTYDTPIICVIHSNEGVKSGDDGRGWLGKELTRKAESNLLLKKDGDITTITSEKQRKAPITEDDGIAFRWSDSHQRHISCERAEKPTRMGGRRKIPLDTFLPIFPTEESKALTKQQLLRYALDIEKVSDTTFRDLLSEGVNSGVLVRNKTVQGFVYYAK